MCPEMSRSHESNTTLHKDCPIRQPSLTRQKDGSANQINLSIGTSHDRLDMQVSGW